MSIDAIFIGLRKADKEWEAVLMIFIGLFVGISIAFVNLAVGLFFLIFSWISAIVIFRRSRERKTRPQIHPRRDNKKSIVSQLAKASIDEENDD